MAKGAEEDRKWKEQFGDVRQPIWIDHQGYRLLVAGTTITPVTLKNKKNLYFADVLSKFLEGAFGSEWGMGELAKPFGQQHVIVQWRTKALTYMSRQPKSNDGTYVTVPTGAMSAYFCLAYDLFTVQDNGRLDLDLMGRLKHPDQFQGARHELFAEATCLRAGFKIEHEDERDGLRRHAEFIATHKKTGQKVSVEAKSKHRSGVLGRPGRAPDPKECDLSFGQLLNDAIAKNPPHPLVVFLNTNVPPETARYFFRLDEKGIPTKINALLDRVKKHHGGADTIICRRSN